MTPEELKAECERLRRELASEAAQNFELRTQLINMTHGSDHDCSLIANQHLLMRRVVEAFDVFSKEFDEDDPFPAMDMVFLALDVFKKEVEAMRAALGPPL